ncbi:signal peptidase I [Nocardioides sp.]|uniref:signal peptidase I n=1 Tax=Nocardioides sp. TaxID=35761 RepID=UPI002EDB0A58
MSSTTTAGRHATAAPPSRRGPRRGPRRAFGVVIDLVLVGCLLVFALLAVGPHLFGYRTSTMLTGSMEPGISPGDVVVTTAKPAADVEVGDVITYQIPIEDHRVETHRVVEVLHRDGSIAIRTKGDANDHADPWTATLQDDQVWEVRAVVPELGTAIRVLRAPVVQHGVFWAALAGLLALGLTTVWRRDPAAQGSDPA